MDEINFYGFVVSNYKSEIIDFIYSTLEQNWSEVYEKWENENTITFHVQNLKELIDSKDPMENQRRIPSFRV